MDAEGAADAPVAESAPAILSEPPGSPPLHPATTKTAPAHGNLHAQPAFAQLVLARTRPSLLYLPPKGSKR
ncbi:hypothetical protein AB0E78_26045 [Streptomyces sp. NPDC032198]|uniref:hypothetical protein n=1 Tax=Streptomyces sp. NPDC032198 TaxID=3155127 RepID=UPI0034080AE7